QRAADVNRLTEWLSERDRRIAELENASTDRLEALERAGQTLQAFENEAQQRAADVQRLTGWLGERDKCLMELQRAASERLEALEHAGEKMRQQSADVAQLTGLLSARDRRMAELDRAASERLELVNRLTLQSATLQRAADERESALGDLKLILAKHKQQIAAFQKAADDRLEALKHADALLQSTAAQAKRHREEGLRLQALVQSLEGRLLEAGQSNNALREENATLLSQLGEHEKERRLLVDKVFALEHEKLLHLLIRRIKKGPISA
ncbi:MAG: hypothetical protein LLG20_11540, partial [Acidobacteriales bacterium]|nr:hypothetical protein [Terriglobales bacterium]